MRMTKRGIGVDRVSFSLTSVAVYGNDKFAEWGQKGVRLSKLVNPGGGELVIVLRLDPTVGQTYTTTYYSGNSWRTSYTAEMKKAPRLPKFGLTGPVAVDLSDDGQEMRITMPPADKRTKLLRGPNKKKTGKAAQLEMPGVSAPYTNTIEKVMADIAKPTVPVPEPQADVFKPVPYPEPKSRPPVENGATLEQALDKVFDTMKKYGLKLEARVTLE